MVRKDGSRYLQVLYRVDGRQTSTSFEDPASATRFKELVDKYGPAKALQVIGSDTDLATMTLGSGWTITSRT
jgi:hypothetical protein